MSTTTRTGRSVAALTTSLFAIVLLGPAPAHAAGTVSNAELETRWGTSANTSGCTSSDNGTTVVDPVPAGKVVTRATGGSAVVKDPTGAETRIKATTQGSTSYTTRDGQLSTFDVAASGRVELDVDPDQTCAAAGWSSFEHDLDFTLTRPQWLTITATGSTEADTWASGASTGPVFRSFGLYGQGTGGTASTTWYLPAGTYELNAGVSLTHRNDQGKQPFGGDVLAGTGKVHVVLHEAGSAVAPATGPGKAYAALGHQVACATRTVPVTFTARAGKVRSAAFYVDGRKTRVVSKPRPGARTNVPGLSATRTSTVRARLVVDPPGRRKTAVVTTTRTYRACATR